MFKKIDTNTYQSNLIEAGLPPKIAEATTRIIADKISSFNKLANPFIWLSVPTLGASYIVYNYFSNCLETEITHILKKVGINEEIKISALLEALKSKSKFMP